MRRHVSINLSVRALLDAIFEQVSGYFKYVRCEPRYYYTVGVNTLYYGHYIMGVFSNCNDIELLERFQSGIALAYEEIYQRYWQILFRFSRRMLQDDVLAEDVVQEIFTVLWQKREDRSIHPPLAAYLYSLARNKVLDMLKHSKVESRYLEHLRQVVASSDYLPDTLYIQKELAEQIETEIQNLPEKMRTVFQMSRQEHKTNQEIADELGISQQTVKNQISNAIRTLRGKLGDSISIFLLFF